MNSQRTEFWKVKVERATTDRHRPLRTKCSTALTRLHRRSTFTKAINKLVAFSHALPLSDDTVRLWWFVSSLFNSRDVPAQRVTMIFSLFLSLSRYEIHILPPLRFCQRSHRSLRSSSLLRRDHDATPLHGCTLFTRINWLPQFCDGWVHG